MSERTRDGLEAARARDRTGGGQKPKLGPRQVGLAREVYDSGEYTVQQIADEFGVTRPTIYRHLQDAAKPAAAKSAGGLPEGLVGGSGTCGSEPGGV